MYNRYLPQYLHKKDKVDSIQFNSHFMALTVDSASVEH